MKKQNSIWIKYFEPLWQTSKLTRLQLLSIFLLFVNQQPLYILKSEILFCIGGSDWMRLLCQHRTSFETFAFNTTTIWGKRSRNCLIVICVNNIGFSVCGKLASNTCNFLQDFVVWKKRVLLFQMRFFKWFLGFLPTSKWMSCMNGFYWDKIFNFFVFIQTRTVRSTTSTLWFHCTRSQMFVEFAGAFNHLFLFFGAMTSFVLLVWSRSNCSELWSTV